MKRLLPLAVLVVVAGAASACDVTPAAAKVDGVTISQSDLDTDLNGLLTDDAALCVLEIHASSSFATGSVATTSSGAPASVSTGLADTELSQLILGQLERSLLARHHATVTASDRAAAAADLPYQLAGEINQVSSPPAQCSAPNAAQLVAEMSASFRGQLVGFLAAEEKLAQVVGHVDVSPAALAAYYASHTADFDEACLDVVVADSAAAAQTIHDQLASGTPVATVATGAGVDTQETPQGGTLPCEPPAELDQTLGSTLAPVAAALADGAVSAPSSVQAENPQTGQLTTFYVVFEMRQHSQESLDQVSQEIRLGLLNAPAAADVVSRAVSALELGRVEVNPQYGTWNDRTGMAPPVPPRPGWLLDPGADMAAS